MRTSFNKIVLHLTIFHQKVMILRHSLPVLALLVLFSCNKEDAINDSTNGVTFNVNSIGSTSGRIADVNLDEAAFLLITIENADGSPTNYTLEKIKLYKVGSEFISQKIALIIGDYKLTQFFVTDSENNIIYIAPLDGSVQAQNVSHPLPIGFTVLIDQITSIGIEVISTENLSLKDFGLAGFNLSEIDVFSFLVNVSERGNYENLLGGTLTITSEDYQFTKELLAIANNSVVIKDGFSSYTVTIEKRGYESYNYSFSRDSLGNYKTIPLVIELQSELLIPGDTLVEIYLDGSIQEYDFWSKTNITHSDDDNTTCYTISPIDWNEYTTQVESITIYPSRLIEGETVIENVAFPSFDLPIYIIMRVPTGNPPIGTSFNAFSKIPSNAVITINSIDDTINGNIVLTTYHPLNNERYNVVIYINDLPLNIDL
jgi:hypothetical protein